MIIQMENFKMIKKLRAFRDDLNTLLETYPLSDSEIHEIQKELKLIKNDISSLEEE